MIKAGSRLKSQVCDTEVVVIKIGGGLDDLRAGGVPMAELGAEATSGNALDPAHSGGTVMGKRYVDDTGAEVLVTKAGAGSLSIGETPMTLKEANPLPASD